MSKEVFQEQVNSYYSLVDSLKKRIKKWNIASIILAVIILLMLLLKLANYVFNYAGNDAFYNITYDLTVSDIDKNAIEHYTTEELAELAPNYAVASCIEFYTKGNKSYNESDGSTTYYSLYSADDLFHESKLVWGIDGISNKDVADSKSTDSEYNVNLDTGSAYLLNADETVDFWGYSALTISKYISDTKNLTPTVIEKSPVCISINSKDVDAVAISEAVKDILPELTYNEVTETEYIGLETIDDKIYMHTFTESIDITDAVLNAIKSTTKSKVTVGNIKGQTKIYLTSNVNSIGVMSAIVEQGLY